MWSITCAISAIPWRPITKSLGGRLYYVKFVSVTRVDLTCIVHFYLYGIESMPLIRPPSPGLAWGKLPGVMFRLRRGGKVGHGIVVIPQHCLSTFILKGLDFPM